MRKLARIRPESSFQPVLFKKTGKFRDEVPLYEYKNRLKLENKKEDEEEVVELD